jgi:hypothetical protein
VSVYVADEATTLTLWVNDRFAVSNPPASLNPANGPKFGVSRSSSGSAQGRAVGTDRRPAHRDDLNQRRNH